MLFKDTEPHYTRTGEYLKQSQSSLHIPVFAESKLQTDYRWVGSYTLGERQKAIEVCYREVCSRVERGWAFRDRESRVQGIQMAFVRSELEKNR